MGRFLFGKQSEPLNKRRNFIRQNTKFGGFLVRRYFNMFDLDWLDKITGIISHFAIFVAMIGLIAQLWQNWRNSQIIFRDRFVASTARYVKIQELLLSNDNLNHINVAIYRDRLQISSKDEANIRGKELAMCAMMFQLMEDVWLMNGMKIPVKGRYGDMYAGWKTLFEDWMSTDEIIEKWDILKHGIVLITALMPEVIFGFLFLILAASAILFLYFGIPYLMEELESPFRTIR